MGVDLFVGNLSRTTTGEELASLFARAGEVVSVDVMRDPGNGRSRGFAFIAMSAQNEADRAVSMFNSYSLDDHTLKVLLARPRAQRGTAS
jgi:RNA recognition motif-containing protein